MYVSCVCCAWWICFVNLFRLLAYVLCVFGAAWSDRKKSTQTTTDCGLPVNDGRRKYRIFAGVSHVWQRQGLSTLDIGWCVVPRRCECITKLVTLRWHIFTKWNQRQPQHTHGTDISMRGGPANYFGVEINFESVLFTIFEVTEMKRKSRKDVFH